MKHSFIIIDDETDNIMKTLAVAARFQNLQFIASATSYEEGLNLILEHQPALVFLEINPRNRESNLSLQMISELHRFLTVVPKIIVTTDDKLLAYDALKHGAFDYLSKPVNANDVRKLVLLYEKSLQETQPVSAKVERGDRLTSVEEVPLRRSSLIKKELDQKEQGETQNDEVEVTADSQSRVAQMEDNLPTDDNSDDRLESAAVLSLPREAKMEDKPLIICVKSYGDYRFIEAKDICYLQADNNSTDIHLYNGEMITAFKTLKHFESVLSFPFVRIHNSYIVNIDYVSRIHTGNSVCYIKNTTIKLPFSKSYKENVDAIINSITKGNYLEI